MCSGKEVFMKKFSIAFFLLPAVLALFTISSASAQTATDESGKPVVVKAVAPAFYPPIAISARAEGRIIVEIKMDAAGKVISARAFEGHPLLRKVAEKAAERWQFAPVSSDTKDLTARLTFVFKIAAKGEETEITFRPPYQVEMTIKPPVVIDTPSH
jgi:TonB family protein